VCILCVYKNKKWNCIRRGRDDMIIGFTTTCAIAAYHLHLFSFDSHSQIVGLVGFWCFMPLSTISQLYAAYHHYSCVFEPRSWRGVLDTTLCDKVCK
jgi:hypothetical protein